MNILNVIICAVIAVAFFAGYVGLVKSDEYLMGSIMATFGWFMAIVVFTQIYPIVVGWFA